MRFAEEKMPRVKRVVICVSDAAAQSKEAKPAAYYIPAIRLFIPAVSTPYDHLSLMPCHLSLPLMHGEPESHDFARSDSSTRAP